MKPHIDMTDEELQNIFEDESRSDMDRLAAWMFTPSQDWFVEAVPLIHNVIGQLEWALGEIERLNARLIKHSASEAMRRLPPELLSHLREQAMLSEATASAALAASGDEDGTGSQREIVE